LFVEEVDDVLQRVAVLVVEGGFHDDLPDGRSLNRFDAFLAGAGLIYGDGSGRYEVPRCEFLWPEEFLVGEKCSCYQRDDSYGNEQGCSFHSKSIVLHGIKSER